MRVWEYYAIANGPLTSQVITEVMSVPTAYTLSAFGVCGANTPSPFDTNPSLPKITGGLWGTSHSNTVTTSNPKDFIFAFDASQGNPSFTPLNGYTSILTGQVPSWMASSIEYKIVSSTQSGSTLGFTLSAGESGSQIVDAIADPAPSSVAASPLVSDSSSLTSTFLLLIAFGQRPLRRLQTDHETVLRSGPIFNRTQTTISWKPLLDSIVSNHRSIPAKSITSPKAR